MTDINSIDYEKICVADKSITVSGEDEIIYLQIDRQGYLIQHWNYKISEIFEHLKGIDNKIYEAIQNKGTGHHTRI